MKSWSKKATAIMLMIAIVIGSMPGLFIMGEGTAYAADFIGLGSGTASDPYQIANADQLNDARNHLGNGFSPVYYKLTADIDLNVSPYKDGAGWEPIGTDSWSPFIGNVNGNGYKIKNLKINRSAADNQGLFGYTARSTFTNMALENVNITGSSNVGGIVGYSMNGGTINNSYSTGSVKGQFNVGGIVGNIRVSGTINGSYSAANVSGPYGGGLVGYSIQTTINNSYATGNVSANLIVGGLVGYSSQTTINNSNATGNVSATTDKAGGLVGVNDSSTITNSYARGIVTGPIGALYLGGLAGLSNNGTYNSSYYEETTGQNDTGKGDRKLTAEMKSSNTYTGWDLTNLWGIDPSNNNGYPILRASLHYDGNGNSGGQVHEPLNFFLGVTVTDTVYGNTGSLLKTGYSFNGWNTLANGAGRSYAGGDLIELSVNTTLFANWKANTYTVTFDAQGGAAVSQTQEKQYGSLYGKGADGVTNEALPTTTKSGYAFAGWYTGAGGTGTLVTDATAVSTAAAHTLYAKWTANVYTVSFDAEGGTAVSQTQEKQYGFLYGKGADGITNEALPTTTRSSYTFAGWYTGAGGTGSLVTDATAVSTAAAHTLYAKWTANAYTVSFDAEGGTAVSQTQEKQYGSLYGTGADGITNEALPTTTKSGYAFAGWYTGAGGTGSLVTDTTAVSTAAAHTLYAKWTANVYTVSFDAEGGTAVSQTQEKQYGFLYGTGADGITNEALPTTTRSSYTFAGWYTGAGGTGSLVADAMAVSTAAAHTLYAKWTANVYTVSFDAEGGTAVSQTQEKQYGSLYGTGADGITNEPLPTTTKSGYAFAGWYTGAGGTGSLVTDTTAVSAAAAHTLYAKWTADAYTVSFDAEGGTAVSQTQEKQYGSLYGTGADGITNEPLPTTTKSGYAFAGWYTGAGGTGSLVTDTTAVSAAAAHTLYAKWTADAYTVSFDAEGGTAVSQTQEKQYGSLYGKSADGVTNEPLPTTTRSSYTFAGWYTGTGGTGSLMTDTTAVTTAAAHTLYAKWTKNNSSTSSGGGSGNLDTKVTTTDGKITLPAGKAGQVGLEDEITIDVPVGATDQELTITINKVTDAKILLANNEVLASPIFGILTNFPVSFEKPTTITIVFDSAKLKTGQTIGVFVYDEAKKSWSEVHEGKIAQNRISVETDHLAKVYAVLVVDQATGLPAADVSKDSSGELIFSDIAGHWAEANIKQVVSSGIVFGYPDGTFKPNKTVTRAEFSVMLMNALKPAGTGSELTFADTKKIGSWARKAVAQAVQINLLKGYEDGTFRPDAEITRAELAAIIARALGHTDSIESNTSTGFADDKNIPGWVKDSVAFAKQAGIVQGKSNNLFAPHANATRAEAVTVILKLVEQQNK